jgi:hypothetical protein
MGPELRISWIYENKLQFFSNHSTNHGEQRPSGKLSQRQAHIVKFDGTNHFDWKYEFLGILEQHGLKHLIEPTAGGDVVARPNVVKFFSHLICIYLYSYYSKFYSKMHSDLLI